jgi:hypothetical protein
VPIVSRTWQTQVIVKSPRRGKSPGETMSSRTSRCNHRRMTKLYNCCQKFCPIQRSHQVPLFRRTIIGASPHHYVGACGARPGIALAPPCKRASAARPYIRSCPRRKVGVIPDDFVCPTIPDRTLGRRCKYKSTLKLTPTNEAIRATLKAWCLPVFPQQEILPASRLLAQRSIKPYSEDVVAGPPG